jgi:hypothetical protein
MKFAAVAIDTNCNLPPASLTPTANLLPVLLTPVANLPTVSTTQAELVAKFSAGVVDTSGATGVIDTSGKFAPVSLTTVVHLDLRIPPRSFEKIRNDPNVFSEAWGKVIHEKSLKQKISWHGPFNLDPLVFS